MNHNPSSCSCKKWRQIMYILYMCGKTHALLDDPSISNSNITAEPMWWVQMMHAAAGKKKPPCFRVNIRWLFQDMPSYSCDCLCMSNTRLAALYVYVYVCLSRWVSSTILTALFMCNRPSFHVDEKGFQGENDYWKWWTLPSTFLIFHLSFLFGFSCG